MKPRNDKFSKLEAYQQGQNANFLGAQEDAQLLIMKEQGTSLLVNLTIVLLSYLLLDVEVGKIGETVQVLKEMGHVIADELDDQNK